MDALKVNTVEHMYGDHTVSFVGDNAMSLSEAQQHDIKMILQVAMADIQSALEHHP